jgi:hypothetical protein
LQYQPYANACLNSSAHINPRLHEIIVRLGEICLSPELAHIMLYPAHALAHQSGATQPQLDFTADCRAACLDPASVFAAMDTPQASTNTTQASKCLANFQASCLPAPVQTTLRQPIHVCAWKVETPSRICLYTGEHPTSPSTSIDPASLAPHTLSKVLLDERSKRPVPTRIHILQHDAPAIQDIRTSLLHYAQTGLTPHCQRLQQPPYGTPLDHTLEEAVACLIHPPARNHTTIQLNQRCPWDKDHIDSR